MIFIVVLVLVVVATLASALRVDAGRLRAALEATPGLVVEHGIVRKSGAWYTYEGDQLGQGKENARAFLRDNPDLSEEIEKRIKEKLGIGAQLGAEVDLTVVPVPVPVDL